MDFRQFFDGFFKLNEELDSFFGESVRDKDVFFGSVNDPQPNNISPRDMMLKNHQSRTITNSGTRTFIDMINDGESLFRSSPFENTLNNSRFEEKIVIRDGDGNEKIITKHSSGGRTTQKEIHRKGNQIVSEKEVVSDIGDFDLGQIGFQDDQSGNFKFSKNQQQQQQQQQQQTKNGSWMFWNWFK